MFKPLPPLGYVKARFDYNPEIGVLSFKEKTSDIEPDAAKRANWNKRYAGKEAGSVAHGRGGYRFIHVWLDDSHYCAHRLIWLLMTGEVPPDELDHKDRDATNNSWLNLRLTDRNSNTRNASKRQDNTSGHSGVSWSKAHNRWKVQIQFNKRRHTSLHESKNEAVGAAIALREKLGFAEGHGAQRAY